MQLGRLSGVLTRVSLALVAVLAVAGCATFTDNDLAARVGDTELTQDQYATLARDRLGDDVTEADTNTSLQVLSLFLVTELAGADLDALGVDRPGLDGADLSDLEALESAYNLTAEGWLSLPAEVLADDRLAAHYAADPTESLVCTAHILTDTREQADAATARLADGEDFGAVASELSLDPGSAANGGQLGCIPLAEFQASLVPEYVDAALAAEVDVPTEPVESEFGYHVIRLLPLDELAAADVQTLRFGALSDWYDVYLDPRLGQWDALQGLAPLG